MEPSRLIANRAHWEELSTDYPQGAWRRSGRWRLQVSVSAAGARSALSGTSYPWAHPPPKGAIVRAA